MSLQTRLTDLATAIATDIKQLRIWLTGSSSGSLSGLNTTAKTSIVSAINEVNNKIVPVPSASTTTEGVVQLATLAEMAVGTHTTKVATVEGVRQERIALRTEILGSGVPSALDTLDELSAALGDDANFASTITTALANRVRHDVSNQALTTTQQDNARINIAAVGTAEIGNPETDLVAMYNTAKT